MSTQAEGDMFVVAFDSKILSPFIHVKDSLSFFERIKELVQIFLYLFCEIELGHSKGRRVDNKNHQPW